MSADTLARALAAVAPHWRLRVNRNRGVLLSLRGTPARATVSVHEMLLDDAAFVAALPAWIAAGGQRPSPVIEAALRRVQHDLIARTTQAAQTTLPPWEPVGAGFPLARAFAALHAAWFAHTPLPQVTWARRVAPGRRLTHIRFGCYRAGTPATVSLHPRLDQPWVARVFVEHVLFHELCHHAQACRPLRGEAIHSERFRAWERRFPQHGLALAWERAYLPHLLAGTAP